MNEYRATKGNQFELVLQVLPVKWLSNLALFF